MYIFSQFVTKQYFKLWALSYVFDPHRVHEVSNNSIFLWFLAIVLIFVTTDLKSKILLNLSQ